jgi:hypothetical protein
LLHSNDYSAAIDMSLLVGKCAYMVQPAVVALVYNNALVVDVAQTVDSTYLDRITIGVEYPLWRLRDVQAVLTKVASAAAPTVFDPAATYINNSVKASGRYDFSRRRRFVYLALAVANRRVGNLMLPALSRQKMCARIPLYSGQDSINYLSKDFMDGTARLSSTIAAARSVQRLQQGRHRV